MDWQRVRTRALRRPWGKAATAEGVADWHEGASAAVRGVPPARLARAPLAPSIVRDTQHRWARQRSSSVPGLAARKPRHPAPRSRAGSPRSGQPLYLRFPGKQFLFVTEKSPALVEEGGALPPLHANGPLLVLIFLIRGELKQPLLAPNH